MKPQTLAEMLGSRGLRCTIPRVQIFEILHRSPTPMTITQLIAACPLVDKVSVYRTIKLFTEHRIVTTVTHGWKQSYELAAPFKPHHHHMTCERCGSSIEIHSEHIEGLIESVSATHQFTAQSHHFEIRGVCAACSSQ